MLSIDGFESLVDEANTALLYRAPVNITHRIAQDLNANAAENENVISQEVGQGANIYALWARVGDSDTWKVMYIGQRTRASVIERIKQHLFKTPSGTKSKLDQVSMLVLSGNQIGLTTVLINPDPVRLAVEDQLIFRNTNSENDLPWNKKSRNAKLRA